MSLFKVRDIWHASCDVTDEDAYDSGCLCVANIDNSSQGYDKIIVSNFCGHLCIYNPSFNDKGDNSMVFKAEHLVLNTHLESPILQVSAGVFVSGKDGLHLGVLHPRKLTIYAISEGGGAAVGHGNQFRLTLCYEHDLQRSAFHFCYGPFGQVKGKDNICVQSMDGTLSVYEQEAFSFLCFLPGTFLPGPLKYVAKTDSFVTVSSARQLESYRYETLAVARHTHEDESQRQKTGKRASAEWTYNLGEEAVDLYIVNSSILVLGERSVFCISDSGQLIFCKKLEYDVSCLCPYSAGQGDEGSVNYILASHTATLLIYSNTCLKWAASMDASPVQVCVANLRCLPGVIVTVDGCGHVRCSTLGTHPTMFTAPLIESRQISYDDMDAEMLSLQQAAKKLSQKTPVMPNFDADDDITVMTQVSQTLEYTTALNIETDLQQNDPSLAVPALAVWIKLKSRVLLDGLNVHVVVKWPLAVDIATFNVSTVAPSKPHEHMVHVYQTAVATVPDLTGLVKVRYTNAAGAPRIVTSSFRLPLKLIANPALPVKVAEHKITMDTNKEPVSLADIYPDFLGEGRGELGAALGFCYLGGALVTVLVSKTSQRYRIQSDLFEALWLVTFDLFTRLRLYFSQRGQMDFEASYTGTLPFKEVFEVIDVHFEHRLQLCQHHELLSQKSSQFRVIQRRLLSKFKDKTPSSLSHLDTLLEANYQQIMSLTDTIMSHKMQERRAACGVSACIHLFVFILQIWLHLPEQEVDMLKKVLCPDVSSITDQGWEENVDSAVTHILRTTFSRTSRDSVINPAPLVQPDDLTKFKKHIVLLCDKLEKGARLSDAFSSTGMHTQERDVKEKPSSTKNISQASSSFHASSQTNNAQQPATRDNDFIAEEITPENDFITRKGQFNRGYKKNSQDNVVTKSVALPRTNDTDHISSHNYLSPPSVNHTQSSPDESDQGLVPDLDNMG